MLEVIKFAVDYRRSVRKMFRDLKIKSSKCPVIFETVQGLGQEVIIRSYLKKRFGGLRVRLGGSENTKFINKENEKCLKICKNSLI